MYAALHNANLECCVPFLLDRGVMMLGGGSGKLRDSLAQGR